MNGLIFLRQTGQGRSDPESFLILIVTSNKLGTIIRRHVS